MVKIFNANLILKLLSLCLSLSFPSGYAEIEPEDNNISDTPAVLDMIKTGRLCNYYTNYLRAGYEMFNPKTGEYFCIRADEDKYDLPHAEDEDFDDYLFDENSDWGTPFTCK